jgi:hypothetical protein
MPDAETEVLLRRAKFAFTVSSRFTFWLFAIGFVRGVAHA